MSACCDLAGPLRHVAGFPDLRLLRVLRPVPTTSADDGPSRPPARRPVSEGPPGRFPRSLHDRLTREVPSYAPAASPRLRRRPSSWPPDRRHQPVQGVPRHQVGCAQQPSPHPPDSSWRVRLRGVQMLVSHVHLLVLLAGPEPSGSTGPSRRCRGCCPPSPASPGSGCPQLHPPAATGGPRRNLTSTRSHSASWRSKSASHSASGRSALTSRCTRSGLRVAAGSAIVVRQGLPRRLAPWRPCVRIRRLTRSRRRSRRRAPPPSRCADIRRRSGWPRAPHGPVQQRSSSTAQSDRRPLARP